MDSSVIKNTEKFAIEIRMEIMKMLAKRGFGHVGGCLSCSDLVAALYEGIMRYDPKNPNMEERDRLVISKGHAGPTAYAALALKGFFPMDWLMTLNEGGTHLPSHCDRIKTPGIDFSTGSLGQGLSLAVGAAYAYRMDGKDNDIYVLLGDGEIQEGQIWEAAMAAYKYGLDKLYCFVDSNKYQIDGSIDEIMPLIDIAEKFRAFGWHTQEINGHDAASIYAAVDIAKGIKGKPCAIILDTVKGYGVDEVSCLNNLCHHMAVSDDLSDRACGAFEVQLKCYE